MAAVINGQPLDEPGSDGRLGPQAALEAPFGALPGTHPQPLRPSAAGKAEPDAEGTQGGRQRHRLRCCATGRATS